MPANDISIGSLDGNPFRVSADKLLTGRTAVIGMSGSGKSHLIGVLCEELCALDLAFVVIDPEGEYNSLKEKFEVVWACNSADADVRLNIEACRSLAEKVVMQGGRLIFDTSESSNEFDLVTKFLEYFYETEDKIRRPILLIVEEADRFVPQSSGQDVQWLHEISRRGRKRGIGLVVATQRPAMVDKNVLSQCGNQLIGRLRTENDLKAVGLFFKNQKDLKRLPDLERGQFNIMGDVSPTPHLVQVKQRVTTANKGHTPELTRKGQFKVKDFISKEPEEATGYEKEPDKGPLQPETERSGIKAVDDSDRAPLPPYQTERVKTEVADDPAHKKQGRNDNNRLGFDFKLSPEEALAIVNKTIGKGIFTGEPAESIELCEGVFWPMLLCNMETASRGLFGLNVEKVDAILDCRLVKYIGFNEQLKMRDLEKVDGKLTDCGWKEIRALRELTKNDLGINDLVPRTHMTIGEVRGAITSLKRKSMVVEGEKIGQSHLYRPLVKVQTIKPKDVRTFAPTLATIPLGTGQRIINANTDEKFARELTRGLFEDTELAGSSRFMFPFYMVSLRKRKSAKLRVLLICGLTGGAMELDDYSAMVALA